MIEITTRAALGLTLACALGACSKEDQAEKRAPLGEIPPAPAVAPVTNELSVWNVRFDDPAAQGFQMTEQPSGWWLVNSGSTGGITWRDGDLVQGGPYRLIATFSAPSSAGGGKGYGVFVGGRHLKDPDQAYTAFLIRPDGRFAIQRREGTSNPTYVDWTPSPAIEQPSHGGGTADNTLEVRVEEMATHFLVNGTEVQALPNERAQSYGTAGIELDRGGELTVKTFEMHGQGASAPAGQPVLRNPPDTAPSLPR